MLYNHRDKSFVEYIVLEVLNWSPIHITESVMYFFSSTQVFFASFTFRKKEIAINYKLAVYYF